MSDTKITMRRTAKTTPSMLAWSADKRERLTLVLSWLRTAAKRKDAPEGIRELADIAAAQEKLYKAVADGSWAKMSEDEKCACNKAIFGCIEEKAYERSILNPDVATRAYGSMYAQVIATVGRELIETTQYLMRGIRKPFLYACELIAEIFGHIEKDGIDRGIKQSLYYYAHDYCREYIELRMYEMFTVAPGRTIEEIIRRASEDESALYDYGLSISDNVLATHRFLAKQPQETIDEMARTFVNGFIDSFETMRIDRAPKKTVSFDTFFGFERVTARAIDFFREEGLEPLLFLFSNLLVNSSAFLDRGMAGPSINRQYGYDHRKNYLLILQRPMIEEIMESTTENLERYKDVNEAYAGIAVQEIFGEPDIKFVNKRAVPAFKGRSGDFFDELRVRVSDLYDKYRPSEKYTFTIIAYPVPSIGPRFEEVFRETIACNNLSNAKYKEIQQKLIDVLDLGAYVTVTGRGINETNMKVMLHTLTDPAKQTNFENCGADVNIPVGEVFTSPLLTGTEGLLHVVKECVDGITYKNLRIRFENGMITDYSCENFPTEAENKAFLKDVLLKDHKTLPIGEFAIGTNTVAYAMGIRCDVQEQLPILIAEKTGPHFAVGDTCYSRAEEHALYNPDGKEIIARENELSALRNSEPEKAYVNTHTDITIPYNELGEILVHAADGTVLGAIIRGGRFVVPGTEELNVPLEELEKEQ
jgi:Leucyl aminopeptidase (aminopeptidase T)